MKANTHASVVGKKMNVVFFIYFLVIFVGSALGACPSATTKWSTWAKAPSAANQDLGMKNNLNIYKIFIFSCYCDFFSL